MNGRSGVCFPEDCFPGNRVFVWVATASGGCSRSGEPSWTIHCLQPGWSCNTMWAKRWKNMAGPKPEIQCGPNAEQTLRAKTGKRIGDHIMHHHMVAAAEVVKGGRRPPVITLCGHLFLFLFLPAISVRRLAHIVFRILAPPCFFGFWPTLYFRTSLGPNPIVSRASRFHRHYV